MLHFFFYLFAAVLIFACLNVVLATNPLYNVLSLVVAIFSLSSLFVLLEAYFVSMILLLVYAGAVLVFFLFVVMCLNVNLMVLNTSQQRLFKWLGSIVGALFAVCLFITFKCSMEAQSIGPSNLRGTIENIGRILFTNYLLPFELTSLLLLIAIFGICSLAQGALSTGKKMKDVS